MGKSALGFVGLGLVLSFVGPAFALDVLRAGEDRQVVQKALEGSKELIAGQADLLDAQGALAKSRAALGPQVSLSAGQSFAGQGRTYYGTSGQASLSVSQSLYNANLTAARASSEYKLRSAQLQNQAARQTVAQSAWLSYWGAVVSQKSLQVMAQELKDYERLIAYATEQAQMGLKTNQELAQLKVAYTRAQLSYDDATRQNEEMMRALKEATGQDWSFASDLPVEGLSLTEGESHQRRDAAELNLQAARLSSELTKKANSPQIALGGSVTLATWGKSSREQGEWSASLNASLPLGGAGDKEEQEAAKLRLQEAQKASDKAPGEDQRALEKAKADFERAQASLNLAGESEKIALEALRLTQVGYDEGLNSQKDLIDAKQSASDAQVNLMQAQLALLKSWSAYYVLLGTFTDQLGL